MRIAIVTDDYLPNIGGLAAHVVELSRALVAANHDVTVWTWWLGDQQPGEVEGVRTLKLPVKGDTRWPAAIRLSCQLATCMREHIEREKIEILHVHSMAPLSLSCRWLGSSRSYRRIFTNHTSGYLALVQTWLGRRKAKFYCGGFDGLLAPSEELLEKSRLLGLGESRCRYIPNGVDPDKFKPGDKRLARESLGLPSDRLILLATRRIVAKTGLRYLAMALRRIQESIPSVLCVFCGSEDHAEEVNAVKGAIANAGLQNNVRFEGAVPNNRINVYLDAADIVVLPSLMEATSISGLEAMSAGKPIVGTRVGGIPALIEEGRTGILVEPYDEQSLADGILRLVNNHDFKEFGRRARERVLKEFNWQQVAVRTVAFYNEIWERGPR